VKGFWEGGEEVVPVGMRGMPVNGEVKPFLMETRWEGTMMRSKNRFTPRLIAGCLLALAISLGPTPALAAGASPNAFGKPTADNWNPGNNIKTVPGTRPTGWQDQTHSEILARNGVVATSEPQAAQAGLKILQDGGNAVDAAVAAMAMIALQESNSTGLGADMFAIIWDAKTKKLYQISANGISPRNYTPELFGMNINPNTGQLYNLGPDADNNYGGPGTTGIFAAMVPGSVDGWDKMLKRFGTMTFKEVLEPARKSAVEGFPVHEIMANSFHGSKNNLCDPNRDPDTPKVFCKGGDVPGLYSIFRNPDLGHAFEVLQKKGRDAFYKGEIAQAIVKKANSLGVKVPGGGPFWTMDDLKKYEAKWVKPLKTTYHGYDIYETPPPSQGWAALEMLNILEVCAEGTLDFPGFNLADLGKEDALFTHIEVEAKKLAYSDLLRYNADPNFHPELYDQIDMYFNNKTYAAGLCKKIQIDPPQARPADVKGNVEGGTIYGASADRWGNMVSFVYSVYTGWGSYVTIPGYGFQLTSRGGMFTFDPNHPNTLAGHKEPFITIIAGFIMKDGEPQMAFGNMGGSTQPLGHVQHIVNMIDLGYNVQATSDAARWDHSQSATSDRLSLDVYLYDQIGQTLASWGHQFSNNYKGSRGLGGGYQGILFERDYSLPVPKLHYGDHRRDKDRDRDNDKLEPINGVYRAGTDSFRKDGAAVGW
jgi:gamma-glutamyltranspeptidase/glutathione hydrolase